MNEPFPCNDCKEPLYELSYIMAVTKRTTGRRIQLIPQLELCETCYKKRLEALVGLLPFVRE